MPRDPRGLIIVAVTSPHCHEYVESTVCFYKEIKMKALTEAAFVAGLVAAPVVILTLAFALLHFAK
jgi:hypothetical protein